MSTLTIEIEEDAKAAVEQAARDLNLSTADFVKIVIAQSLARRLKDPLLEARSYRSDGTGFRDFLSNSRDVTPEPGDE